MASLVYRIEVQKLEYFEQNCRNKIVRLGIKIKYMRRICEYKFCFYMCYFLHVFVCNLDWIILNLVLYILNELHVSYYAEPMSFITLNILMVVEI